MGYYIGIDVSLEVSHFCVVDVDGKVLKEAQVASEPDAILEWLGGLGFELQAIGLEAGPLSQWLYAAMSSAGLPVVLLETRQVSDAFRSMPVKTDRKERAWDCPADAAWLVSAGPLQVAGSARDPDASCWPQDAPITLHRY